MDAVLVNPASRMQVYQDLGVSLTAIQPPVWAGLLATFLRRKGLSVQIIDADADQMTPDETAQRILDMRPRLVAMVAYGNQPSASTQVMPGIRTICSAIKEHQPDTKIILVGGHAAALPKRSLEEEAVDYVCSGEGPYTLVDLLQALGESERPNLSKVRDLWYWEGDQIRGTLPAPLVTNLDQEMPEVAWDLLPVEKYRAHNWHAFGYPDRVPYGTIYTTLGCPYHCTFCCIQAPFKSGEEALGIKMTVNSYRFWTPEAVIAQIDTLVNIYGVKHLKIADEMFVLNQKHVEGICDLLIERNYDLNIWAYARVDTVRGRMVEKLKRAGINWLALGIESASERVRVDVQKNFGPDLVERVVKDIRQGGINVIANYIFGLPEDDMATMQETLDMALDLNCEFGNFYSAIAYPGSQLYDLAIQKGWPLPQEWSGYSQHALDTLPLSTNHISGTEVLRFRDQAFKTYFGSPKYLDMIAKTFNSQTAQQIHEMASVEIERKYN